MTGSNTVEYIKIIGIVFSAVMIILVLTGLFIKIKTVDNHRKLDYRRILFFEFMGGLFLLLNRILSLMEDRFQWSPVFDGATMLGVALLIFLIVREVEANKQI